MCDVAKDAGFRVMGGTSLDHARRGLTRRLAEAGVATPGLDARLIVMAACGLSHADLILRAGDALTHVQAERLEIMVSRRLRGEPVSRILGVREFWGLCFDLSPATLDPRPDTETLVQSVLDMVSRREGEPLRILDLGTGTGCVLIALLRELPSADGIGVDISHAALATARSNARRNGVGGRAGFVLADWLAGIGGRFDIVVSNPPYIARDEIADLSVEVRAHEPVSALDGGTDGLAAYRAITPNLSDLLRPGGVVAFEVGKGQAPRVAEMVAASGVSTDIEVVNDLSGIARVVVAQSDLVDDKSKKQLESGGFRDSL